MNDWIEPILTIRPLAARKRFEERMRHIEDAGEVDRDDVFPIVDHGFGCAQHAVAAGDAGIVDQDRDLPDLFGDLLGHRDAVVALGDVEQKALGLAAGVADFRATSAAAFSFMSSSTTRAPSRA